MLLNNLFQAMISNIIGKGWCLKNSVNFEILIVILVMNKNLLSSCLQSLALTDDNFHKVKHSNSLVNLIITLHIA